MVADLAIKLATQLARTAESPTEPSTNDVPVLRRAAMDVLARREHSQFELRQKLSRKFPEADTLVIDAVIETLREEKLQSDDRFTEYYVRYRKSRGFAYLHIRSELAARYVPQHIIEAHLFEDDADWNLLAHYQVQKRLRGLPSIKFGDRQHRAIVRFLESRGFTLSSIRKVLEPRLVY